MARYRHHAAILDAAQRWREVALAADSSMFTDRAIWSRPVVEELRGIFDLDAGAEESGFEARLKFQLSDASPDATVLAGEMLWVLMLFPTTVSGARKRNKVRTVLAWAGEPIGDDHPAMTVLDAGIGNPGQGYMTHQAFELNYMIEVAVQWKRLGGPEQQRLLSNPWAFGDWINQVPERGERQLWHILPFLVFPAYFEQIAAIVHKRQILEAFHEDLDGSPPWVDFSPATERTRLDIDLFRLRRVLESKYQRDDLEFYRPPLNEIWRDPATVPPFDLDQTVFDEALSGFRDIFKDFETFEETGETYVSQERGYKDELATRFRDLLSSTGALERPAEEVGVALVDGLLALLQDKLETIDQPQNLIGWRSYDFLRHLDESEKITVARILLELLDTEVSSPSRVARFNDDIWPILERHDSANYAISRSVPTLLLMLWDPDQEVFVRTRAFNQMARRLTGSKLFKNKRLDAAEYRAAAAFAGEVRDALRERGLAPRDMVDVQGWIWCALSAMERADEGDQADQEDIVSRLPGDLADPTSFTALMAHLRDQGLYFEPEVVANYLIALETRRLVILAGISGTGKTRLAMSVAKFLQEGSGDAAPADGRTKVIAVRPDWTDPKALLGYHNPILDRYVPTDFLRILIDAREEERRAAQRDRTPNPYFVILDEMNLARVEHYFADFLSALESDSPIALHDGDPEEVEAADGSTVGVPPRLRVPQNVFFTGTVNVDETTHMFSPKVLDRAFTIELNKVDLATFGSEADEEGDALGLRKLSRPLRWERRPGVEDWTALAEIDDGSLQALVRELNDSLTPSHRHFGYRVANEIGRFVGLVWARSGQDTEAAWDALDLAILQKVLPKLHGTEQELDSPLRAVFALASGDGAEGALKAWGLAGGRGIPPAGLDGARPRLPRTAAKVLRMRDRLRAQGFTSFLE